MVSVTEFKSYREFLKAVFAEQRANHKDVRLVSFAKSLDLSTSGLQMILDGSRNLTVHKIHAVAKGLRLSEEEHAVFETLVHFEQAESAEERKYYEKRLKRSRAHSPVKTTRVSDRDLLADWYLPAFLIYLIDRRDPESEKDYGIDYAFLKRELGLDRARVDALLDLLQRRGVLRIQKSEKVHIVFDKVAGDLSKKRYLLKVAEEMRRRMDDSFSDPSSYFQGHTFTLPESELKSFVTEYKELLDKYIAKGGESDSPTKVFQTLFCLSAIL